MRKEINDALDELESEARIAETHDIGMQGAERLHAAALLIRRFLWGAICVVVALWLASCTKGPEPAGGADLVAAPGVSAPVVERVRADLATPLSTSRDAPRAATGNAGRAAMVAPVSQEQLAAATASRRPFAVATAPAFDCHAYAISLLPWRGDPLSPVFRAASDALLPDAPEFAARRTAGCAVLEQRGESR